jgi:uncharacterized membrane protein
VIQRERVRSVDALRGAIIVVMAIDHVRDFINSSAMSFSPTDLNRTTVALFFTRWITHFCAPVFAFTAGIGAFLWLCRDRTPAQLSRFLVTRGLWLMVLEVTVLRVIFSFDIRFANALYLLTVFWMLGLSMVVLAGMIHLPPRALGVISIVVIVCHNLLDPISPQRFGGAAWLWDILHQQAVFRVGGASVLVAYPLIPWFAVMAAGYSLGPVLLWEPERRRRFLLRLGGGLTLAFLLVRGLNIYGDPARWRVQRSLLFTVLSFLNTTKYPPSLAFLLMTLGPAIAILPWLERKRWPDSHPFIVFGRVPFFFFLAHLALIHVTAILLNFFRYGAADFLFLPTPSMGGPRSSFPPGFGFDLWVVYAVWVAVVAMLYPVCRWFAGLKQRRRDWWLSYL